MDEFRAFYDGELRPVLEGLEARRRRVVRTAVVVTCIVLALVVMAPPAAMAYLKYRGLGLDRAFVAWIQYQRDPRRRVWRKGFLEYLVEKGLAEPEAPTVAVNREALLATVMVLLNLMVIAILISATWYMWDRGFNEVARWLRRAGK